MGHQSELHAGEGNDFIWVESAAQDNTTIEGNAGDDIFVLGGNGNIFSGGEGSDTFILNNKIVNAQITDINQADKLVFADMSYDQIWFEREQNDLLINLEIVNSQQSLNSPEDDLLGNTASVLTLTDYFNGQQADIVVNTVAKTDTGEDAYEALTQEGLAELIAIMSTYDVVGSSEPFFTNVTAEDRQTLATSWDNTVLRQGAAIASF